MKSSHIVITLFLSLVFSLGAFSQTTTISPYSKYGIGLIRDQSFARNFGMGGAAIGIRSYRDIGLANPASYSAISVVTFDVGYSNSALTIDDGTETQYQNSSYINHIALAVPMVKNVWGLSFGVLPYANVGYSYDQVVADSIAGDISFYNEGEGGLNKAYLGNAIGIKIDSTSNVSIGANTYFIFGSIERDQKAILGGLSQGYNIWNIEEYAVADFGADFGLQYQKTFTNAKEEVYRLAFGATYGLAADLSAKRNSFAGTFSGTDPTIFSNELKDTVLNVVDAEDIIQLPATLGFGLSFEKDRRWLFAVDYKTTDWGAINSNDDLYSYKSNYALAAGVEFIPKYDGNNYLQRIAYRVGGRFTNSYIAINDIDWNESGISFGFGLPVRKSENSYPRLNFGFEYGTKGTTEQGLIKEKFFNMNVGVTINATWFRKRKYD
jgi:hypothetical protein